MRKVILVRYNWGLHLTDEARAWLEARGIDHKRQNVIARHHPLLIECLETLGEVSQNPAYIIPISGTKYNIDIDEHGREYINEPEDIEWEDTEQW